MNYFLPNRLQYKLNDLSLFLLKTIAIDYRKYAIGVTFHAVFDKISERREETNLNIDDSHEILFDRNGTEKPIWRGVFFSAGHVMTSKIRLVVAMPTNLATKSCF